MARRSRHIGRLGKVGIRKVTVPSLSGLSRSQAKDLLNSVGLNWTETSSIVQNINLDNVIENQGIASGATVKIGDSVSFSYYLYVAPTTTTPAPTTTTTPAPPPYPNIGSVTAYGAGAGQAWTQNQAYITWGGSGWGSYTVTASNGSSNNSASSGGGPPVLLSGFSAGTSYSVTVTLYANANYSGSSASASTSFTTASAPATTTTTTPAPPTTTPAPSCGIMPNVVGLSESAASNAVVAQGIAYEYTVEYNNSQGATAQNNGTVAAQDPQPGFNTGTCNYTYNATLYIYRYTAATTTTTTAAPTYPTLLSGYHYCAAGDAPNPASPCPGNGSGTGVNCVLNGASGPSCPDPNATTTTTTAAPTTTTTTAAPQCVCTYSDQGTYYFAPQCCNAGAPYTGLPGGLSPSGSCCPNVNKPVATTTTAAPTTAATTTTTRAATTSRPLVYWKCNSADVANPSNPCGYVGQCLYDGNTYFPAGC